MRAASAPRARTLARGDDPKPTPVRRTGIPVSVEVRGSASIRAELGAPAVGAAVPGRMRADSGGVPAGGDLGRVAGNVDRRGGVAVLEARRAGVGSWWAGIRRGGAAL